jgi:hypothetical protein
MSEERPPTVAGAPCTVDPEWSDDSLFAQIGFCKWVCPHCQAHLTKDSLLCLNGCGLSVPDYRKLCNIRYRPLGEQKEE